MPIKSRSDEKEKKIESTFFLLVFVLTRRCDERINDRWKKGRTHEWKDGGLSSGQWETDKEKEEGTDERTERRTEGRMDGRREG